MRRFPRRFALGIAILIASLLPLPGGANAIALAQPEQPRVGMLASLEIDQLPSPEAEVWFLRYTLEPGAIFPLDVQIGPTIIVVEVGALTLETDRPIEVTDGAVPLVTGEPVVTPTVVTAGQAASIGDGTSLTVRNAGDAPATMLALFTFAPDREMVTGSESELAEPPGVTQQTLGLSRAEFPAGAGTVTIERLVLEPGGRVQAALPQGTSVGAIEQGNVSLMAEAGGCFIWTSSEDRGGQSPEPVELGAGETTELSTGDGFGCLQCALTWQAGEAGATIIRAQIIPLAFPQPGTAAPT